MKNTITLITLLLLVASCGEKVQGSIDEDTVTTSLVEKTETVSRDSIIQCTGEIAVRPEDAVSVHSPIGGLIKSIHVMEGEQVKKGEILATLEHLSIIELQGEYLAVKSEYILTQKNHKRIAKLYQQAIISDKEFDQSEQAYQSALALYEGLKSQVNFLGLSIHTLDEGKIQRGIPIRSPITGSVTSVAVTNGQFVAQDTKLFNLLDDSHKHVHLQVFAEDVGRLQQGQTIWLKTADNHNRYEAEVFLIGKNIEQGTNSISVHGHLKQEASSLIVGSFVFAEIQINE